MGSAERGQWLFPANEAGKVLGWEDNTGKHLENKTVLGAGAPFFRPQDYEAAGDWNGSDGTDDTVALQACFDAAAAAGGIVKITKQHKITDEISLSSNLTIEGGGNCLIRQVTNGKKALVGVDVDNVTIDGVRVQGVGSSTAFDSGYGLISIVGTTQGDSSNIRIRNCETWDGYDGIAVTLADGVWVTDNTVHDFYLYGVLTSQSINFHVDDNNIYGCDQAGAGNGYGISCTGSSGNQKQSTICRNTIRDIKSWDGIMSHQCDSLLIADNVITDVRAGIDISTTSTGCTNIIISGNYIKQTTTDTWSGSNAIIWAIQVLGASGNLCSGIQIVNNVIDSFNAISGAGLSGNSLGIISLEYAKDSIISGNTIKDVVGEVAGVHAIGVYACDRSIIVSENVISGSFNGRAIQIQNASGGTLNGIHVINNRFWNTGAASFICRFTTGTFNDVFYFGNTSNLSSDLYTESGTPTINVVVGEGTFTPVVQFGGGTTGITYSQQRGYWRRFGSRVEYQINIVLTSKGTSTGIATITGLPSAPTANAALSPLATVFRNGASITSPPIVAIQASQTYASVYQYTFTAATQTNLSDANFVDTTQIHASGTVQL